MFSIGIGSDRAFANCSPSSLAVRAKLRENLVTPFARARQRRISGSNVGDRNFLSLQRRAGARTSSSPEISAASAKLRSLDHAHAAAKKQ